MWIADTTLIAVGLGLLGVGAIAALLIDRRDHARAGELPLWRFMLHAGTLRVQLVAGVGERAVRLAEMRCALCSTREECAVRLAAGEKSAVADCPNTELFRRLARP